MSSPVCSQIHSTGGKREVSSQVEKTITTSGSLKPFGKNNITNKNASQESRSRNSTSLGRNVALRVSAFTGGFSSEEDSDCEGDDDLNTSRGIARSLGHKEMSSIMSASGFHARRQSNIVPVSERSAAYKELISSSQNSWMNTRPAPRHSAMKLGDGSDTSPVQTRLEQNPFLQLDKLAKTQPAGTLEQGHTTAPKTQPAEQRQMTSPAHLNVDIITIKSSVAHAPSSPTISGMSVQMRIKVWAEKEQEAKVAHSKLTHRRSLQTLSLLRINGDGEPEGSKEVLEYTAHSDDESIKNKSSAVSENIYPRTARENSYEVIDDKMERYRVEEASSSSSENTSPSKSPKNKKREKKVSSKASKKNSKVDSPDLNQKRKWKIKSPLQKRKKKVKKKSKDEIEVVNESPVRDLVSMQTECLSQDVKKGRLAGGSRQEDEEVVDDVFSPVSPCSKKGLEQKLESKGNILDAKGIHDECGVLPSVFDKVDTPPQPRPTKESRSISREIFSIIDSLGTIDENRTNDSSVIMPAPSLAINELGKDNSESGSTDVAEDGNAQSSLDMQSTSKLALRRRASDENHSDNRGRKGGVPAVEQNAESLIATALMYADAVWDREAADHDELSFRVGDVIEILDMTDDVWWHGSVGDSSGWFPSSFVRLRVGQDSDGEDIEGSTKVQVVREESVQPDSIEEPGPKGTTSSDSLAMEQLQRLFDPTPAPSSAADKISDKPAATLPRNLPRQQGGTTRRRMTIRRKDPSSSSLPVKLTPKQVRAKIIEEIISTERDYVKHLEDIIEGYVKRCLEYNTLFDEERIEVIFSNVDKVYDFQKDFLRELEARVKPGHMAEAEIGEVFVLNQHEFKVYSQYCNNHPYAVGEMSSLQENEQYCFFFESCRLLRNLQDISLEGFLLTPVQKICKYPLQLSELLKYTSEDHPDYAHVMAAHKAMKGVALLINEQKRRIENMGKIGCWQRTIEGWKGPDVLENSTEMIHSGELHKISKGHSQERHFFLFDHQLVYCKKDTIGGRLCYKGRVDLDHCQIADITEKVLHGNTPVKNCWHMNNKAKDNKWYIIYAKSPQVKEEWMIAFERERERVREDEENGFYVSIKVKRAAVALCANDVDYRRRGKSVKKHVAFSESIDGTTGNKKLAMTVSIPSSQTVKKNKAAKRKLNSISGSSSAKVIF